MNSANHSYLFCLLTAAAMMWATWKLRSKWTTAQKIVGLSSLAMYIISLCGFLLSLLWQARTIPMNELPNVIFFEMQGFYSGLNGVTRILYLLAAACYVVWFGMRIGTSLFNAQTSVKDKIPSGRETNRQVEYNRRHN